MEARLQAAERAFRESPGDGDRGRALAREALRAGRLELALEATRGLPVEDELRGAVASELADRLDLTYVGGVFGFERFRTATGVELVLVLGGAFLEDGASAWTSSLEPSGSRASLRPRTVGSMLVGVEPRVGDDRRTLREWARAAGGRLPSPAEWKKAWRGGLHLDGDRSARVENPAPDRLSPLSAGEEASGPALLRSPYGALFRGDLCEWCSEPGLGLILDTQNGRYTVELGPGPSNRQFGGRVVIELPGL